jgi:UDP-glucose 4-epimerase
MRILVTGGAGYIGTHTLVALAAQGHSVHVLDDFSNSDPAALARVHKITGVKPEHTRADLRDETALAQVFAQTTPEAVIHFAGLKAVGASVAQPVHYYDVNVGGTLALLKAMQAHNCGTIIFSSSATVYGTAQYLPFDEAHPCAPISPYGRSKHMIELILEDWAQAAPERAAVSLRYFNPGGAHGSALIGEDPRGVPGNLIPYLAQVATGKQAQLSVFGNDYDTPDGTGLRDYIHVMDLAEAHVAALDFARSTFGAHAINIGTGTSVSVLELIAAFERACGAPIPRKIAPRRAGDVPAQLADPRRAEALLNWRATRDLDAICTSAWAWAKASKDG